MTSGKAVGVFVAWDMWHAGNTTKIHKSEHAGCQRWSLHRETRVCEKSTSQQIGPPQYPEQRSHESYWLEIEKLINDRSTGISTATDGCKSQVPPLQERLDSTYTSSPTPPRTTTRPLPISSLKQGSAADGALDALPRVYTSAWVFIVGPSKK